MQRRALFAAALAVSAVAAGETAAASGSKERKKGGGASFLQIPTLTASLPRPDGRRGVLTVECGVDATDAALRTRAEQLQPRLRDAFNTALMRFAAGMRPGFAPDADVLSRELQAVTDKVLGRKGARLLLGTILVS